jgi:hypothetical protein
MILTSPRNMLALEVFKEMPDGVYDWSWQLNLIDRGTLKARRLDNLPSIRSFR